MGDRFGAFGFAVQPWTAHTSLRKERRLIPNGRLPFGKLDVETIEPVGQMAREPRGGGAPDGAVPFLKAGENS